MPRDVRIVTSNLDNDSTLKWQAPAASASGAIRHQVLWRETAASDWQYGAEADRYAARGKTKARLRRPLPVSKDNVISGVRACDRVGHCSEAVTPLPEVNPASN